MRFQAQVPSRCAPCRLWPTARRLPSPAAAPSCRLTTAARRQPLTVCRCRPRRGPAPRSPAPRSPAPCSPAPCSPGPRSLPPCARSAPRSAMHDSATCGRQRNGRPTAAVAEPRAARGHATHGAASAHSTPRGEPCRADCTRSAPRATRLRTARGHAAPPRHPGGAIPHRPPRSARPQRPPGTTDGPGAARRQPTRPVSPRLREGPAPRPAAVRCPRPGAVRVRRAGAARAVRPSAPTGRTAPRPRPRFPASHGPARPPRRG